MSVINSWKSLALASIFPKLVTSFRIMSNILNEMTNSDHEEYLMTWVTFYANSFLHLQASNFPCQFSFSMFVPFLPSLLVYASDISLYNRIIHVYYMSARVKSILLLFAALGDQQRSTTASGYRRSWPSLPDGAKHLTISPHTVHISQDQLNTARSSPAEDAFDPARSKRHYACADSEGIREWGVE